jgi:predicted nuclease of predicted toxin-antitoxin system
VRWLADECVSAELVTRLRDAGHDVSYVCDFAPRATDAEVAGQAHSDARLLLTEDKDFGELVFRQQKPVPGLVLLRIAPEQRAIKWARLRLAIEQFGDKLFGRYTVIEPARLRSRLLR